MKVNENDKIEIIGMDADDLIDDINTIKTKLDLCIHAIEKGELDKPQALFLKKLGLFHI